MEQKYQDKLSDDIKFPKIKGSYQTPHPVHYPHAVHLPQDQRQLPDPTPSAPAHMAM